MTTEIALTLLVIAFTLVAFIREWGAPDVLALSILCAVVALGLVEPGKMLDVFKNEAPLTIAALFVIGGALETSGAVDHIGASRTDCMAYFGWRVSVDRAPYSPLDHDGRRDTRAVPDDGPERSLGHAQQASQ